MAQIPKKMYVASIDRFGPPSVLKYHKLPVPPIAPNDVLIYVHTAGIGSWDPEIRAGWWPEGKPKFPVVLGTDGSGTVTAVGSRVRNVKVRDKVYAHAWMNPKGGFYAQYIVVPAEKVAPIPRNLDLRRAGAIPATGLTALQGIDDHLQVQRGENVIIHGASGAVGSLALEFARLRGAHILATATAPDGLALAKRLGAHAVADGKKQNLTEAALRFFPEGVDAIFATAGGKPLEQCMKALKPGGRLVYPNGVEPEPKKHKGIKVVTYDAIAGIDEFARLTRATEAAQLKVVIAAAFPLEAAAKAHQRVEAGHVLGRVVLKIR
jgi:NADPH2:quinone reductase